MKAGWQIKRLAEICLIQPPKNELKKNLESSDLVSFVPMENLGIGKKYLDAVQFRPLVEVIKSYTYFADGDVLLAKITPCFENGKLGIAQRLKNGVGFGSSEYIVFRASKDLNNQFLYYFLSRETFREEGAMRMAGAVGHKRVSKDFIENYAIPIPPLPEQKRIVAILDEAFAGIATATATAERNLANARALFESYLQSVFENKGEEWEQKKINQICELKPQKKEAREKLNETDLVTFLPMEDFGVLTKDINGVKERQLKNVAGSYTYFAENDVLLAKITPCFENGKIGIARNLINGVGFGSSEYIVFRLQGAVEPEYLYYFLSRNQIRDEGKKYMGGAVGHKRVSKDWIENYIIPFPAS